VVHAELSTDYRQKVLLCDPQLVIAKCSLEWLSDGRVLRLAPYRRRPAHNTTTRDAVWWEAPPSPDCWGSSPTLERAWMTWSGSYK